MNGKPKILIVDDDQTNLRFLNEVLGDDYEVQSVSSGEDALKMISGFLPDAVLLDIMLPGISGYDVCTKIRKDEAFSKTKIILISAKAMEKEKKMGLESGGDAYITKPFDHVNLLEKLNQTLNKA